MNIISLKHNTVIATNDRDVHRLSQNEFRKKSNIFIFSKFSIGHFLLFLNISVHAYDFKEFRDAQDYTQ